MGWITLPSGGSQSAAGRLVGGTHQVAAIPLPIGRTPTRRTDPQDASSSGYPTRRNHPVKGHYDIQDALVRRRRRPATPHQLALLADSPQRGEYSEQNRRPYRATRHPEGESCQTPSKRLRRLTSPQGGVILQSGRPDSNRRPHRPERCALPSCATSRRDPGV